MTDLKSWDRVELALQEHFSLYVRSWGPISWRSTLAGMSSPDSDPRLADVFWALSNIEDESAYMRRKIRWARADRLQPIEDFNVVWLAEEAEHARLLAKFSELYGGPVLRLHHGGLARDRRSSLGRIGVSMASPFKSGMLASYLTLGAMQEHTALTVYNALSRHPHVKPEIGSILREVGRQEGRHMRFYRKSAQSVLAEFPHTRTFVSSLVTRTWRPVGIDLLGVNRWKSLFYPVLNYKDVRENLIQVDAVASELIGKPLRPMSTFLKRNP